MPRLLIALGALAVAFSATAQPKPPNLNADMITEIEALRYENAFLKLQRVQTACEAMPEYAKVAKVYNAEMDAITVAHHMDIKAGDRFDPETRVITRKTKVSK